MLGTTTLRRRRDEWIDSGVMDTLQELALESYNRTVGLALCNVSVNGCITQGPLRGREGGEKPGGPRQKGIKRSTVVDANGIPLAVVSAPANRHDYPLLAPTLDALKVFGQLAPGSVSVHLDRGYDSSVTRELL